MNPHTGGERQLGAMEWLLALITAGLAVLACLRGGGELAWAGLAGGIATLRSAALLVIFAFALGGLVQVLVPPSAVKQWLGGEAGLRGIGLGMLAGAFTPGGPYVYYPLALALYRAGAGMGTIMAYITAKIVWDLARLPLELGFLGPRLTAIRWAVTLFVPPIAGLLGGRLLRGYRPPAPLSDRR